MPRCLHQVLKQGELSLTECGFDLIPTCFAADQIQCQMAGGEGLTRWCWLVACQDHFHFGNQLFDKEGFRQVIVGASLKADQAVIQVPFGAQNDDGRGVAVLAQLLQQVHPIELGQHQIQQHQVVFGLGDVFKATETIVHVLDLEAGLGQTAQQKFGDFVLVLDQQDFLIEDLGN